MERGKGKGNQEGKSIVDKGKKKREDIFKRTMSNFYSPVLGAERSESEWEKNLLFSHA